MPTLQSIVLRNPTENSIYESELPLNVPPPAKLLSVRVFVAANSSHTFVNYNFSKRSIAFIIFSLFFASLIKLGSFCVMEYFVTIRSSRSFEETYFFKYSRCS